MIYQISERGWFISNRDSPLYENLKGPVFQSRDNALWELKIGKSLFKKFSLHKKFCVYLIQGVSIKLSSWKPWVAALLFGVRSHKLIN